MIEKRYLMRTYSREQIQWPDEQDRYESKLDRILEILLGQKDKDHPAPIILTLEEASKIIKASLRHMNYLLHEKKCLPYFLASGQVRIRQSDLIEYINQELKNLDSSNVY